MLNGNLLTDGYFPSYELAKALCEGINPKMIKEEEEGNACESTAFHIHSHKNEKSKDSCCESGGNEFLISQHILTPPPTPNDDEEETENNGGFLFDLDNIIQPIDTDKYYEDLVVTQQITNTSEDQDNFQNESAEFKCVKRKHDLMHTTAKHKVDRWNRNTYLHNILERKRRQSLKQSFSNLRASIPSIHDNEKAPKIMILTEAIQFIQALHSVDQKLKADLELERCKNEILREQMKILRNC